MAISNLASRFLVALIAAPVLLAAMYLDRPEYVWALVFGASLIAMHEFFAMTIDDRVDRYVGVAIGAAAGLALYWVPVYRGGMLLPMFIAVMPTGIYYVLRFGDQATVARRFTATVAGIFYGGIPLQFLALIKLHAYQAGDSRAGGHKILLVVLTPWVSDTFAYFTGRALGKRKLYPAVSPGKTVAGGVGGLVGACGATAAMKLFAIPGLSWLDVAVIGVGGGVLCQLGDLIESLLKRSTGVKDSGTLFAGHGGMLDRIDAVLVFAPFVYLYLLLRA